MAVIDADGAQDIGAGVTMPRMLLKSLYLGCAGVLGSLMMIDLIMIVGTLSTALAYDPTGSVSAATIMGRLLLLAVAMNILFWFRHRLKLNVARIDALKA